MRRTGRGRGRGRPPGNRGDSSRAAVSTGFPPVPGGVGQAAIRSVRNVREGTTGPALGKDRLGPGCWRWPSAPPGDSRNRTAGQQDPTGTLRTEHRPRTHSSPVPAPSLVTAHFGPRSSGVRAPAAASRYRPRGQRRGAVEAALGGAPETRGCGQRKRESAGAGTPALRVTRTSPGGGYRRPARYSGLQGPGEGRHRPVTASSRTSRPSLSRSSPMTSGGRKRTTLP